MNQPCMPGDQGGKQGPIVKIWNTNCDQMTVDKLYELRNRIQMEEEPPDIISISEVKNKTRSTATSLEQYKIEGYMMEGQNLENDQGRGLLVYIKEGMRYNLMNTDANFCEALILSIRTIDAHEDILCVSE